tara:strand:+ start:1610 stop:1870 length:261 start_codon:yes stop_codon:yes gene_type:complete
MTKDFVIENVKVGDMLTAYDQDDGTIAHQWIVLENYYDDVRRLGFINVFVMYTQSPWSQQEKSHSCYYDTFKRYRKMMDWSLQHVS